MEEQAVTCREPASLDPWVAFEIPVHKGKKLQVTWKHGDRYVQPGAVPPGPCSPGMAVQLIPFRKPLAPKSSHS